MKEKIRSIRPDMLDLEDAFIEEEEMDKVMIKLVLFLGLSMLAFVVLIGMVLVW